MQMDFDERRMYKKHRNEKWLRESAEFDLDLDFPANDGHSNFFNTISLPESDFFENRDLRFSFSNPNVAVFQFDNDHSFSTAKKNSFMEDLVVFKDHDSHSSEDSTFVKEDEFFGVESMDIDPPSEFLLTAGEELRINKAVNIIEDKGQEWQEILHHMYSSKDVDSIYGLSSVVQKEMNSISTILEEKVLDVEELYSVHAIKEKYRNVYNQANVSENMKNGESLRGLVSLDWIDQPLTRSFKNKNRAKVGKNKKKKGNCMMTAKMFCAPGVSFVATSPVSAHFYCNEGDVLSTKKKKVFGGPERMMDFQIQNNTETMEANGEVVFDFRFPAGTRNKPCTIKLHCKGIVTTADGRKQEVEVVSEPTNKFIVTTNESQYETAELKLMSMSLFEGGQRDCTFAKFVNELNIRWMRVTKQESEQGISACVSRRLTNTELEYFTQNFFPNAPHLISESELNAFYSFFGKVTHHFRHNATLRDFLLDGIVYGFISKDNSSKLLSRYGPGSFLIRASETNLGSFVLSFFDESTVKHSIIDAKVFTGPSSNLAEFILSKPYLKKIVKPLENEQVQLVDTHEAFSKYSYAPTLHFTRHSKKNFDESTM